MCRNGACVTVTVEASGSLSPSPTILLYGSVDATGQLQLFYEARDYRDSDVYDVTVIDGGRVSILHGSGVYQPVYPNGKDCDQAPICWQASITAM